MQHALTGASGRHFQLTADVHNKLEVWRDLVCSLASSPTYLCELQPFSPTWMGNKNSSGSGIGGFYRDPEGQYFICYSTFYTSTQARRVSSSNPTRDAKINDLELGALLIQILIFAPRMAPLAHIHTYINNTAAHGWDNRIIFRRASTVSPVLRDIDLAMRLQNIYASVGRVSGEENKMADAASSITHLLDRQFISHYRTHFP